MKSRRATIAVRRAEPSDADAMRAIFASPKAQAGTLQLPLPSVEMWRKRLADGQPTDYLLVAVVDGEVVGNAGLHAAGASPRRRHAAGIGMAVRDDWHGRGVGTALLTAIIDLADNWLDYTRLELTVYTDNAAAFALYRKFGFETEGTLRQYALRGGVLVDAYTMARLRTSANAATAQRTKRGPKVTRKATKTARKRTPA
ncbi:MAG: GNAT family N-acetyltransferase [Burkholderiales bacterium]